MGVVRRASLLLAQNVPARIVMEILGHSQIALTMNTYSHVAPEVSREAAGRMARMLWQDKAKAQANRTATINERRCCFGHHAGCHGGGSYPG